MERLSEQMKNTSSKSGNVDSVYRSEWSILALSPVCLHACICVTLGIQKLSPPFCLFFCFSKMLSFSRFIMLPQMCIRKKMYQFLQDKIPDFQIMTLFWSTQSFKLNPGKITESIRYTVSRKVHTLYMKSQKDKPWNLRNSLMNNLSVWGAQRPQ